MSGCLWPTNDLDRSHCQLQLASTELAGAVSEQEVIELFTHLLDSCSCSCVLNADK